MLWTSWGNLEHTLRSCGHCTGQFCPPPAGRFWPLRGSMLALPASKKKRQTQEQKQEVEQDVKQAQQPVQDQEHEVKHEQAQGHEPRTEGRKAARPQGLKGPAGCAEHLNPPGREVAAKACQLLKAETHS